MNFKITGGRFYGALIVALSAWILQSFLLPLLVACVTAIASWPLYKQFVARLPRRMPQSATSLIFTSVMTLFVLAPLMFAVGALLAEAHALFLQVAAADEKGIAVPHWVENVPLVGPWLAARWQSELAHPGALSVWTQRTDPTALLGWAQSLGQFMARHVFIIAFTILILFFLYQEGESLVEEFRRVLRHRIGERAEDYVDVATRIREQYADRRAVRWIRNRDRIRHRRRHARRAVGARSPACSPWSHSSLTWPSPR
jgi:predicted PurR-regulated permease PerM